MRNSFYGMGQFEIPIIPKFKPKEGDFNDLRLIGFDAAKPDDERHFNRIVHFFLYDYKFEKVWKEPEKQVERLKRYKAILTPDFSMYTDMAPAL